MVDCRQEWFVNGIPKDERKYIHTSWAIFPWKNTCLIVYESEQHSHFEASWIPRFYKILSKERKPFLIFQHKKENFNGSIGFQMTLQIFSWGLLFLTRSYADLDEKMPDESTYQTMTPSCNGSTFISLRSSVMLLGTHCCSTSAFQDFPEKKWLTNCFGGFCIPQTSIIGCSESHPSLKKSISPLPIFQNMCFLPPPECCRCVSILQILVYHPLASGVFVECICYSWIVPIVSDEFCRSLHYNFIQKESMVASNDLKPKPPSSTGKHNPSQAFQWVRRTWGCWSRRNALINRPNVVKNVLGGFITCKRYMGMDNNTCLIRIIFPPGDKKLEHHPWIDLRTLVRMPSNHWRTTAWKYAVSASHCFNHLIYENTHTYIFNYSYKKP